MNQVDVVDTMNGVNDADGVIDVGALIGTLWTYKWLIVAGTALATALGSVIAFSLTPIYRADALLQVNEQGSRSFAALKDLEPFVGDMTSVAAELEILNSRMVLGRAVQKLGLEVIAKPRYQSSVSEALARIYSGHGVADAWLGLTQYAWGGEYIELNQLEVDSRFRDKLLTLVADEDTAYQLLDEDGKELARGRVGQPVQAPGIRLTVAKLKARPGTQFDVMRRSSQSAINVLRAQFSARERGRKSGIVELGLTGPDRTQLPLLLNEIANSYVRQNLELRVTEADNQLRFLETQLPTLKRQLDAAESAYNSYRRSRKSVDLELETQGVLRSLVEVDTDVSKLRQEREELRQFFTSSHPRVQALDAKLKILGEQKKTFEQGVNRLPEIQQTALRLRRDVEVSTTLYSGLLSTAQQLRVSKAGAVGDVRVIDAAVVGSLPVEPRRFMVIGAGFLLGLIVSMGLVWLLRSLRVVVEDPDTIERKLGLPVLASIPHSKAEKMLGQHAARGEPGLLAAAQSDDDAVESLRSLRTTLHFAMLEAANRSVLITGPSQSIGKSFVSKNLAAVLAQSGKRIVVVDADLRRGHIHKEFGFAREGGVSEFVAGELEVDGIIRPTGIDGLSVVCTGRLPHNPSEMLLHPRFEQLLERLEELFDLVIVDAPPILAVADAAIVGRHTGVTLLLARAGRHPIRELQQAVRRLQQAGVRVSGVIFNDLDMSRQRYRYGYEGYVYRYAYKRA